MFSIERFSEHGEEGVMVFLLACEFSRVSGMG